MKYRIRSGRLFLIENGRTTIELASVKSPFYSVRHTILSRDGRAALYTDILAGGHGNGISGRRYVVTDPQNRIVLSGKTMYATDDSPDYAEASMSHVPHVDRVRIEMNQSVYNLRMLNSQNYCLEDAEGRKAAEIIHDGIVGGWSVEVSDAIAPTILMGIFIFSRYLEKENEFVMT